MDSLTSLPPEADCARWKNRSLCAMMHPARGVSLKGQFHGWSYTTVGKALTLCIATHSADMSQERETTFVASSLDPTP